MIENKIMNVKAEEIGERTVRFKISSEVVDRQGDILVAKGCDFSNFMKNPVFLPFHKADAFPLGKVVSVYVEGNAVFADVYFPKLEELASDKENASEKARLVDFTYHCYKNAMLSAVSVGFMIKDAKNILDAEGYVTGYKILEWELLEFSAVTIPANQEALTQAVKSFGDKAKVFLQMKKADEQEDTPEEKPEGEKPEEEADNIRSLVKELAADVKECLSDVKECLSDVKEIVKELKEDVMEIEEEPEDQPEAEILEIEP
jgi:hypothetical protein